MQKEIQNKKIQSDTEGPQNKALTTGGKQKYHFPGQGVYKTQTIEAGSQKEASEIHEKTREKINKSQPSDNSTKKDNQ